MLADTPIVAFIPALDPARARAVYQDTLGLRFVSDDNFALVFECAGTSIRIVRVSTLTPFPFTLLGWHVPDLEASVTALTARGIQFLQFSGLDQTPAGIWTAPGQNGAPGSGARVAWFHDPDGNILSLSQG
jgi:catechol 2,3-dioxygenase-like lactoylglutathione lyase family enzyme